MTTPDHARYIRDAAADYEARAIVDAWDRADTAARERDALAAQVARERNVLAAQLAAVRPVSQPEPVPSIVDETPAPPAPADPAAMADRIHRSIGRIQ